LVKNPPNGIHSIDDYKSVEQMVTTIKHRGSQGRIVDVPMVNVKAINNYRIFIATDEDGCT
jgi:hypothetical protein